MKTYFAVGILLMSLVAPMQAAPLKYVIDPEHTFPSFEADHLGISIWRGKFNKSAGDVMFDKSTGTVAVSISIDMNSVDFGHDKLNAWAVSEDFFNTQKFPTATFKGRMQSLPKSSPTQMVGEFTLNGVTRPLTLQVNSLKCIEHPIVKRDYCGADAFGVFQRDAYGLDAGKSYGFSMDVTLRIQVEALAAE